MPRKIMIVIGAFVAIAIAIGVYVITRTDDPSDRVARSETTATRSAMATADTSNGTTSPHAARLNDAGLPISAAPPGVMPPPEAMPELADAIAMGRTADAVELCAVAGTRAARPGDCTIAACREHNEGSVRAWFETVPDADQDRVRQACEAVHVTVSRPQRLHPHRPHRHFKGEDD